MRIAIVSPFADESALISMKLSERLKIPCICKEVASDESPIRQPKRKKYTSSEIYTAILAQFHARIKKEKVSDFISDGTVLNEIILKKQEIYQKKMLKRTFFYRIFSTKFHEFEKKVARLIEDYALTAYDKIYFLKISSSPNESSVFFEQCMYEILNRRNISHTIITGDIESSLHDILYDINNTFFTSRTN